MTEAHRGHLAMLLFSALVAGSFSLGAMAAPSIAPAALNALRFVIAAVILGVVVSVTVKFPPGAFAAPWRYVVLSALFVTYFVLMFEGLKTAEPVSMAAVFTLTPLIAAGFGWLFLRQITTARMALALLVGGIGAVWVIFRADLDALRQFRIGYGEWIFFWGCVAHACYAPVSKKFNRGENPLVFTFGVVVSGAGLLILYGWNDILATPWATLPKIVWVAIFYTSIFASAMTFVLLQYAALRIPSAKVMAYTYLTPAWVTLWEIAMGRSAPPVLVLGGIGLTIVALVMLLKNDSDV